MKSHVKARPHQTTRSTLGVDDILEAWTRELPELDPSPIGVLGRIRRLSYLERRRQVEVLSPLGLTPSMFSELATLRRGGPPYRKTPSELAASSMLTTGGMTNRLDKLQAQGFIRRVQNEVDKRVRYAELTEDGVVMIDKAIAAVVQSEATLLEELPLAQRELLAQGLAILERRMLAEIDPLAAGDLTETAGER